MEGFYLYCVRKSGGPSVGFATKGIDEKGEVFTRTFQGLEAVISRVPLEEFDSDIVRNKARNDLSWIKNMAVLHEAVIEEAMRGPGEILSLIPLKFGTIFKDEHALEATLAEHYEQFQETLDRLTGKQEWGVKAYLTDQQMFEQSVKEDNAAIRKKAGEMAGLPEGMAFLMEEEFNDFVSREANKALDLLAEGLTESLGRYAEAVVLSPSLGKELTGKREPMVFNAACLVRSGTIEEFREAARQLLGEIREKGLDLEVSGPWPAYHFATLEK